MSGSLTVGPQPERRLGAALQVAGLVAVLAVLLGGLPFILGPYWQQLGFRALQLLTLAIAWNVLAGYCGQVSLGTGAFVGLGAYAFTFCGNRLAAKFRYSSTRERAQ